MFRRAFQSSTVRKVLGTGVVVTAVAEVSTQAPSQTIRRSALYHHLTDSIVTPTLRNLLNAEQAHDLAIQLAGLGPLHRHSSVEDQVTVKQELWPGRIVPNPIGLAAGFDKDGVAISSLLGVGFGLVEIGSVTLQPQPGNPSPRMFRLVPDKAIINRYGFNSAGADQVEKNLQAFRQKQSDATNSGLVGVNLGKNKTSTTPLVDYQALIRQLGPYADYLVINVSSPNTPGLRDLQASSSLEHLLSGCLEARNQIKAQAAHKDIPPPPLLVKLAPDLGDDDLREICNVLVKVRVDGIILTNTTVDRPESLQSPNKVESGGLSGRPLTERSTECIRKVYKWTNYGEIPIIGVGGIFTAQDVWDKLSAGASAVQVYSGMVYEGPGLVSRLRHEVASMLKEKGYSNIQEVIGYDHKNKKDESSQFREQENSSQRAGLSKAADNDAPSKKRHMWWA